MAAENAAYDANRQPSMLLTDETGQTKRAKSNSITGAIGNGEQIDFIRSFVQQNYPTARYVYDDDFSNGSLNGWREQFDSSTPGRVGLTLTDESRVGAYGLLLHSRPVASDQAWARKGFVVPDGVKKIIKGCYFMFHGANANNPESLNFDFDYQMGTGDNTGSNRRYWRFQYLNHNGTSLQQKWRVCTGTPTQADTNLTDVTGAYMPVGWNESEKPLLCYMVGVFNIETQKYERLFANGHDIDMTAQNVGPTAGASLANYDKGAIDINIMINRSNASEDNQFIIERPFLAYVM